MAGFTATRRKGKSRLISVQVIDGEERELVVSDQAALFPVAFGPDGGKLYYVRLQADGSYLYAHDIATSQQLAVARIAEALTRDWTLSPAGDRLAYLVMTFAAGRISSQAFVLDIETGAIAAVSEPGADAFAPAWNESELAIGRSAEGGGDGGVVRIGQEGRLTARGPPRGFDVPLASAVGGRLAVRSFDGSSAVDPGRSTLVVVSADGRRTTSACSDEKTRVAAPISHAILGG
jgi:hypothetical protein